MNFEHFQYSSPSANPQLGCRNCLDELDHTSESVIMPAPLTLQPTLWRTCRVVPNRSRLALFGLLVEQPDQPVSTLAKQLCLPLSVASEYLRAMEARGLLTVRRTGRWVKYRPAPAEQRSPVSVLVSALRVIFQKESAPIKTIFHLATAFTHPRRILIFQKLQTGARTLEQLQIATQIPLVALPRHLRKLEARGFIAQQRRLYVLVRHDNGFGRELARLATLDGKDD